MTDQHISKSDDRELLEELAEAETGRLEAISDMFAWCQRRLEFIREHPNFVDLFSSEERMRINVVGRSIPEAIKSLRNLRQLVADRSWQGGEKDVYREKMGEIEKRLKEVRAFVATATLRLPEPEKPGAIFWMFYPIKAMSYLIGRPVHRIRIWYQERIGKKIEERKEETKKKKAELDEKIKKIIETKKRKGE